MAMSRSEIFEKLNEVINMVMPALDVTETEITEDSNLVNDIGLSSVGILYVVIAIEEFFGIRFDDVGFADFETIKDVIDYIEKKI
ncbi:MAG: acyl carrier protein [Clostridia bacterium]|jgi:acyl carrier protein|nr:acyl carrier protein [Clostridia bacterium]